MPTVQCPECGKELLPQKTEDTKGPCLCPNCGREVYIHSHIKAQVKCPTCGKENKTDTAV